MKIGILTFHRALNPGAVLQCYALQETLKSLGADVKVINYYQPHIEYVYSPIKKNIVKSLLFKPRKLLGYLRRIPSFYLKNRPYKTFIRHYIDTTEPIYDKEHIPYDYDVYVIGSDQLWSLQCTKEFEEVYLGNFLHKKQSKIIGYAISSNIKSIETLGQVKLKNYINNFESISFREETISKKINEYTNINNDVVLDPTFLLDVTCWMKFENNKYKNKRYIFKCLFLKDNDKIKDLNDGIQRLSDILQCEVLDFYKDVKSPGDFLSIIKYSQFVVTSSFHAVAFSLIYKKQFYAISFNNGLDIRYIDLLKSIGANNSIVDCSFKYSNNPIDYNIVSENIEKKKLLSLTYLKSNIK